MKRNQMQRDIPAAELESEHNPLKPRETQGTSVYELEMGISGVGTEPKTKSMMQ